MQFIEQANKQQTIIKLTAEISDTFLDTNIYKGKRFKSNSVLDVHTHFSSWHPPDFKKGFIEGEAL